MNLFKKIPSIFFIVFIWIIFSSPYLFQNKVPFPSTYLVNFFSPWNSYPGFSSPVKNNAMPDIISQIYPWKTLTVDILRNFQVPLWNPYSLSGTPHLANYQSAVLSPFNLLFFVLPFVNAWSILVLLQPLLAGVFMFLYLQCLKISKKASIFGSISFMFCGFITTWMAYATLGFAIVFLPLSLYAIEKFYESNKKKYLFIFSLTFPLSFFSGHFQISSYFLIFVFLYLIFKYIQIRSFSKIFSLFLFLIIGVFLSLPQLLPSIELYSQSLRSEIFQKIEAIPWGYLPTLIAPDFYGNPVTRNDWFGHYAEWNGYIGLISIMLSTFSIIKKRSKFILFFSLTAIITLLFSFQTPFLDFLVFLKIPVISTSAASRVIVIFSFSLAVLASFGFDFLMEELIQKNFRKIIQLFSIFLTVFAVLWVVVLFKLIIPYDKIIIAKQNLLLPTIIFLFSAVIIFSVKFLKNNKVLTLLPILLIMILGFDMLRFSFKWIPSDPKSLVYPEVLVSKEFKKIANDNRVLENIGGQASIFYKLPVLNGYDAVYIKRYGEFIASLDKGKLSESPRSVVNFPVNGIYSFKAMNLLGVKYLVNRKSDGRSPWIFPFWGYPDDFKSIYDDNYYQILENKNSFPRAFLVSSYKIEKNPQKILDTMFSANLDLRKEVVLEEDIGKKVNSSGAAEIISYTPNKIIISTQNGGNSILFLSDTYYPGWEALVDGRKTSILRADFSFRAIFVPAGNHKVEFIYDPLSFRLGIGGFIFGVVLLVLLFLRTKLFRLPKH